MSEFVNINAVLGFDPVEHRYYNAETGETIISVTQLMKKHGLAPDYGDVPKATLEKAAAYGTFVHEEISKRIEKNEPSFAWEVREFDKWIEENPYVDLKSETRIANDIVAGTVDLIATNPITGAKCIFEIKTTAELHTYEAGWQLSCYAALVGGVSEIGVLWFDRKNEKLVYRPLNLVDADEVEALFDAERAGYKYAHHLNVLDPKELDTLTDLENYISQCELELAEAQAKVDEAKGKVKAIEEAAMKSMVKFNLTDFETSKLKFHYTASYKRGSVDSAKLKKDGLYEKYVKYSTVKDSVKVSVK